MTGNEGRDRERRWQETKVSGPTSKNLNFPFKGYNFTPHNTQPLLKMLRSSSSPTMLCVWNEGFCMEWHLKVKQHTPSDWLCLEVKRKKWLSSNPAHSHTSDTEVLLSLSLWVMSYENNPKKDPQKDVKGRRFQQRLMLDSMWILPRHTPSWLGVLHCFLCCHFLHDSQTKKADPQT